MAKKINPTLDEGILEIPECDWAALGLVYEGCDDGPITDWPHRPGDPGDEVAIAEWNRATDPDDWSDDVEPVIRDDEPTVKVRLPPEGCRDKE